MEERWGEGRERERPKGDRICPSRSAGVCILLHTIHGWASFIVKDASGEYGFDS